MKILLFIIAFTIFNVVTAQQQLTLDACLKYGFENNLEIARYANDIAKSEISSAKAVYEFMPSINAEYNHYLSSGRSLNIETYSWENEDIQQGDINLTANLAIFQGLYNIYNRKAANLSKDISVLELEQKRLLLGLEITTTFYKIALVCSNFKILELTHSNTLQEIKRLEDQIIAGTKPKSNLYELQAQEKKEYIEIIALNTSQAKEYNRLKFLINWQELFELQVNPDTTAFELNNFSSYQQLAYLSEKSVINAVSDKNIALARADIQVKKSQLYPSVSLNSSLYSRYLKDAINPVEAEQQYKYYNQLDNNQYKQIYATISIPIFNRYQVKSNIKMSEIELKNSEIEKEHALQKLNSELTYIQIDIKSLNTKVSESEQMVIAYKKSYEVALDKYRSGLLDSYALSISKNNYTNSMLELNKLKIELEMNIALLNLYAKFAIN